MRTPRSIARSDLVAIASFGVMFGVFTMVAVMYAIGGRRLEAGIWAAALPLLLFGMVFVGRRTLRKIPE